MKSFLKILAVFIFIIPTFVSANDDVETVELTAYLNVFKECRSDTLCSIINLPSGNIKVNLILEREVNTGGSVWKAYKGYWSTVVEKDGLRYVGVLTIRKNVWDKQVSYSVRAEILSNSGVVGDMSISLNDLSKLNYVTLNGPKTVWGNSTYTASFNIGPKYTEPTPIPVPIERKGNYDELGWDVTLGELITH